MRWTSVKDKMTIRYDENIKRWVAHMEQWHPEFAWLPTRITGEMPRQVVWLETVEMRVTEWWMTIYDLDFATIEYRIPEKP